MSRSVANFGIGTLEEGDLVYRIPEAALILALFAMLGLAEQAQAQPAPATIKSLVDAAPQNITTLHRPDPIGFATIWDGNKYVQ